MVEEAVIKINGYSCPEKFRKEVGARKFVSGITIPVIFYFSFDDPVIGTNSIDFESIYQNENCVMTTTHFGSHLCCFDRLLVNRQWMCDIGIEFFSTFLGESDGPSN